MNPSPTNAARAPLPTTSLYLHDALESAGLVDDWESHRSGPGSYRIGDQLIIIRYATGEELALARSIRKRGGTVIYLIDDDLEAIVEDHRLPEDYRQRIDAFLSGPKLELEEQIDEVIVSSPALFEKMHRRGFDAVAQLDPFWPVPAGTIEPSRHPGRIAWLGTRSHAADLESIAGELTEILYRHRSARLTAFFGKHRPRYLRRMRGIENLAPLPWPDYRQWLSRQQFDLALYPLLDTPVNRSRSINKFLEHAMTGAASLVSANAPFADRLDDNACLFVDSGDWSAQLDALLGDSHLTAGLASRARLRAREIAEAARTRQIDFWKERLPALNRVSV